MSDNKGEGASSEQKSSNLAQGTTSSTILAKSALRQSLMINEKDFRTTESTNADQSSNSHRTQTARSPNNNASNAKNLTKRYNNATFPLTFDVYSSVAYLDITRTQAILTYKP